METIGISPLDWETTLQLFFLPKSHNLCRGRFTPDTLYSDDKEFLLLIYREDGIYGALAFSFGRSEAMLSELCVHEELKGAGKILVRIFEQVVSRLGIPTINLIVGTTGKGERNSKLRNWYISQGYAYKNPEEEEAQSLTYPWMTKQIRAAASGGGKRQRVKTRRRRGGRRSRGLH
jgi:hypothetical protein